MGNNCCQEARTKRKNIALLLVGLDNAGKSVTAQGLAGEQPDSTLPTIGCNIIPLHYANYDVQVYDLGGGPNIRGIWHKYFNCIHGIIFVIDSTNFERFKEVREVLEEMLSNEKITGKPLLILANKQDQELAMDEIDLIEYLEIERLANKYCCPTLVQSCAANESYNNKIEPGIQIGYEWLMNYVNRNFEQLDVRVQIDTLEQSIIEKEEMLQKIKRIREEQELQTQLQKKKEELVDKEQGASNNEIDQPSSNNKPIGENIEELNLIDFYPSPEKTSTNSRTHSSSSSSKSFPSVYHVSSQCFVESERPKSAVQMVRRQLHLSTKIVRSQSAKSKSNKTTPYNLYDQKLPHSAREYKRPPSTKKKLRTLKSADATIFTISGSNTGLLSPRNKVGPGGDFCSEMNEIKPIKKLTPIKKMVNSGGSTRKFCNQCGDWDAITVVDID